jgi:hypothetical protein
MRLCRSTAAYAYGGGRTAVALTLPPCGSWGLAAGVVVGLLRDAL